MYNLNYLLSKQDVHVRTSIHNSTVLDDAFFQVTMVVLKLYSHFFCLASNGCVCSRAVGLSLATATRGLWSVP